MPTVSEQIKAINVHLKTLDAQFKALDWKVSTLSNKLDSVDYWLTVLEKAATKKEPDVLLVKDLVPTVASTTYIDPSAGVNGTGTFLSPKNTWSGLTVGGNVAFLQKAGTAYTGTVTVSSDGVSGTQPCILGTYNASTGVMITDGTTPAKINANGGGIVVEINEKADIWVWGLELYGANSQSGAVHTGHVSTASRLVVKYCTIHDCTNTTGGSSREQAGIRAYSDGGRFLHNTIYNIEGEGIWASGINLEIGYNTIYNISINSDLGDNIQLTDDLLEMRNPWIHHNYIDKSNVQSKQGMILENSGSNCSGGIIEFNTLIGSASFTSSGCWGIHAGWPGLTIRGNIIMDFPRAIDCGTDTDNINIVGNLIIASANTTGWRGINFFGGGTSPVIYNNTLVNSNASHTNSTLAIQLNGSTNAIVKNNIVTGWNTGISGASATSPTGDYNLYYNNGTDLSSLSAGAHDVSADPLFVGGGSYRIQTASPAKDAGVNPGVVVRTPNQSTMVSPYDIGCYTANL